jgi:predicted AAA+ superfamily ATPase
MHIPKHELIAVLANFNPWWRNEKISDLPRWRRAIFEEFFNWLYTPPVNRAILLSGARQVGKTTLQRQAIAQLLEKNVPAANILYASFDHPIIKLAGIEAVIDAWRTREPKASGPEYLLLDEAQLIENCGTWVKHQVDFNKERRIIFTGSAMPLLHKNQESGVGRWHTISLSTLSFYEYLQLKKEKLFLHYDVENTVQIQTDNILPNSHSIYEKLYASYPLPQLNSLRELFEWSSEKFYKTAECAQYYAAHFHEYLVRGGFPQTAQIENIHQAQRLLREDIIDRVLKRDMTVLFGVRHVMALEQTFLYLCMHGGGLLDMTKLCENLEVKRPTAMNFIALLEASHLIYRLQPFGYGKEILRAKYKIYLADAAIAPAVLLKGKAMLDDPQALGIAIETAVFKHLFARLYSQNVRFTYWKGKNNHEVDLIAENNNQITPFEIKYRTQHTGIGELKGLQELCQQKDIKYAYVVTKSLNDFGLLNLPGVKTRVLRIPAPLLCYWMGEAEHLIRSESFLEIL